MSHINETVANNAFLFVLIFGVIILILLVMVIGTRMELSDMRRRYKLMMTDADGESLEQLFTQHSTAVQRVENEQEQMRADINRIDKFIEDAITRVAVVRFNAFKDEEAELSYCIALLDDNGNGVIISAITGREITRSYAKSIENGMCREYKLTPEEEQALQKAKGSAQTFKRKGK